MPTACRLRIRHDKNYSTSGCRSELSALVFPLWHIKSHVGRYARNVFDNPIIPLSILELCHCSLNHNSPRQFNPFFFCLLALSHSVEQEPTSADPDSDEEADLVLSLETETGLLTNQHTKGKRKLNWKRRIIDGAFSTLIEFHILCSLPPPTACQCRPLNIIIETFYHHLLRVLHDTIFYDFCNETLLRLDLFAELSQKPHDRRVLIAG